jgi:hypothetical protein
MMTSGSSLLPACALGLALAVFCAAPASAQPRAPTAQELETARTLYKEGKALRASGNLRAAFEKLQAAHALGNTPVTGIELARTYLMMGRLVEAREVCLDIARIPMASDETEKSASARREAATMAEDVRPRIATLVVRVQGALPGEGVHLAIDGVGVPDVAASEPQKVNPGPHQVAARAGEGLAAREARADANAGEGESLEVTLTLPPPLPPPAQRPSPKPKSAVQPDPSPPHGWRPSDTLVPVGFATAVVGGGIGVLAGVTAWNKKDQLGTECNSKLQCAGNGSADLATARTWATISTVSFSLAGAGFVAGVIGLITGRGRSVGGDARFSPWVGPGAAGIHGRF